LPQSLRPETSVEKNQLNGERHISLCEQVPGAEQLVNWISPYLISLEERIANYKKAEKESLKASDKLIYNTSLLKNQLRSASDKVKEYDRDNPGSNLMSVIFPDNLTPLIVTNPVDTPKEVTKTVTKIQSLGIEHPLYGVAAKITEKVDLCNESITKCKDADEKLKVAEAELDVAHLAFIKQYGINILEAKKLFGKDFSEQLFPKIVQTKKKPPAPPAPPKSSGQNGSNLSGTAVSGVSETSGEFDSSEQNTFESAK
jgi:hypothetical protein